MVDKKLVEYVRRMNQEGYPFPSIKNQLEQSGYAQQDIEQALREGTNPHHSHLIHLGSPVVLIIAGLIIAIGGAVAFLLLGNDNPEPETIELSIRVDETNLKPSDDVVVSATIAGSASASVTTELINPKTGGIIADSVDLISAQKTITLSIPANTQGGTYTLRSIADDQGKKSIKTLAIVIEQQEVAQTTPPPTTPDVCDDFNACTTNALVNGQCVFNPIVPCCGNSQCEAGEQSTCTVDCPPTIEVPTAGLADSQTLEEIKLIASDDPTKALAECDKQTIPNYKDTCYSNVATIAQSASPCGTIINQRIKDICYSDVAEITKQSTICESVSKTDRKDSCYLTFVLDFRDYTVCEQIANNNLREGCHNMRSLA